MYESGSVKVDFDGNAGEHTLVCVTYDAKGKEYQIGHIDLKYDPDQTDLGTGYFTDGFISKFLESDMHKDLGTTLPEEAFTYPVRIEESTVAPPDATVW